jgi:DNA repair protein RadA/Sms
MSKSTNLFTCANCDAQYPKWQGRCNECGQWGTITQAETTTNNQPIVAPATIVNLAEISSDDGFTRLKTNVEEIDRVFGGGIVSGSITLLAGEPGIGKSTLVAQIANQLNEKSKILYASGEESLPQVKLRLERLNCSLEKFDFISDTDVDKIASAVEKNNPSLVIIDSIQTVHTNLIPGEAGSLNQIRASAVKFLEVAKRRNIAFIMIGHITKDGNIAGPKSLEHLVDTVLYLEQETARGYQLLRASKNRFGSTNELGIFEMTNAGFIPVKNPSAVFLEQDMNQASGSVVSCIIEGTRPFLVEIQALVTKTVFGYPQRKASGFDLNRLQVLVAVISKRTNIKLMAQDIIVNIVGGLRVDDPGIDAAICAAIISSALDKPIKNKQIILGEIGLGGELRGVSKLNLRLKEASDLGFTSALAPKIDKLDTKKIKTIAVTSLNDLMKNLF